MLFAVIMRFGQPRPALVSNLNKTFLRNRPADSRVDRLRRVDEVQHLLR